MVWKNISDLEIYHLGMQIGELTYELVTCIEPFHKNTIGYQLIRAVDSITANIAEGYGRYHFKDQRRFCFIARGSLFEIKVWLTKVRNRIPEKATEIDYLLKLLETLHIKLNAYIRHLNKNLINK